MESKPTTAENTLSIASSLLILAGIFHSALKLPDFVGNLLMFAAFICLWKRVRVLQARRGKPANEAEAELKAATELPMKKRLLFIAIYAVVCAASPFYMPYTGLNLPFYELVIISVITFIICVTITLVAGRRKQ